jgi:AcrR family transcriptional regulator
MERDVRTRILEGTYACIASQGIARTSLEGAARSAGVSRATLYRYFPGGRDELIGAYEAADYVARMALSFIVSPGRWDLSDPDQVQALVESEILAGLQWR